MENKVDPGNYIHSMVFWNIKIVAQISSRINEFKWMTSLCFFIADCKVRLSSISLIAATQRLLSLQFAILYQTRVN